MARTGMLRTSSTRGTDERVLLRSNSCGGGAGYYVQSREAPTTNGSRGGTSDRRRGHLRRSAPGYGRRWPTLHAKGVAVHQLEPEVFVRRRVHDPYRGAGVPYVDTYDKCNRIGQA